ncbi:SGNH/GDSL hydrolase family protein [Arthrobacter gengyunqii]|uniref:SGNH/GDSL hydrolase family protein n=1 Tax=Arthrobacter gengyunqii TaxID=2886940 RepID=A0ABS8GIS3_9MICC|nr:SGNH/GDSL hydrolase family protein [Arthrobacter gengyunqii]MCC3266566.1 SGNH/GDSL hydrolase family protein [Arthrobacter gengyunqii]
MDNTEARAAQAAADQLAERQAVYDAASIDVPVPDDGVIDYLLVGDSLANGAAATTPALSFREIVGAQLAAKATVNSVLAGKAGQGIDLIAPQALKAGSDFDVIVVEVGTNDVTTSNPTQAEAAAFADSYIRFLSELRSQSPAAALVCLGPWRNADVASAFEEAVEVACTEQGGKFRALSKHYTVKENRWRDGSMPDGTPTDNFHPSDLGHADIASEVLSALRLDRARPSA